ncbi:NucA/NucB deoxyribonuclease domain-containing protein, partial [Proteus vulgaris]|uniref:VENN motif pre-toxin domain-containing protein n=1 Tax=Proteus vulgaris TaxID=585 RepID=UPI0021B09355
DYTNQSDFGTGGKYTRAIQAITAFTQGVMGNNIVTAIANGSAPYLANEVKNQIQGNSVESDIQRTVAHGLVNAGLALAKGENAAAQATGAMTGETVGILSHSLYGKTPEELTESEKQNISAWATLASGIAGGLISDNSAGVANAAQAGKVVVENNLLSNKDVLDLRKELIKATENGTDKDKIFDQFRELSKQRRAKAVEAAKEGKIFESVETWGELLAGVDQADSLKWITWVDSLSAEDRKELVNLIKYENDLTAAAIFNAAPPDVKIALWGKEGLDGIGITGAGKNTGITVISTAIKGNTAKDFESKPSVNASIKDNEPKVIIVDKNKYPETAKHIEDAQKSGHPNILTVDRDGAAKRRRESLKNIDPAKGSDRDEYPPAMFKEGGTGASVRLISPSDNRGAGSCIGHQCRELPDGTVVIIKLEESSGKQEKDRGK